MIAKQLAFFLGSIDQTALKVGFTYMASVICNVFMVVTYLHGHHVTDIYVRISAAYFLNKPNFSLAPGL